MRCATIPSQEYPADDTAQHLLCLLLNDVRHALKLCVYFQLIQDNARIAGLASPRDLLQIAQHAVIHLGPGGTVLQAQHIRAAIAAIDQAQNSVVRSLICT